MILWILDLSASRFLFAALRAATSAVNLLGLQLVFLVGSMGSNLGNGSKSAVPIGVYTDPGAGRMLASERQTTGAKNGTSPPNPLKATLVDIAVF
ncbi:hypothetical protein MY494_13040 [Synechococcus sp. A10-1-5-1]|uniref:hypothetical protein n=1 Tax=Synechococcus sp. A10-1-5-1 TaxID=2936507 RepID=UPI002000B8D1|nr:hypothetical protein [Synechococcus sp. A10-1-5-1]UPM50209.1 hypothetical protein MY494_13040 [Synechococcus sp. A10-1-5-1]